MQDQVNIRIDHQHCAQKIRQLSEEISKVIVGHKQLIERLLIGLFTGGHILLEGVPGLAKTLTISTLNNALDLSFKRIQFTPDLLPADLTGTMVYNPKYCEFEIKKGPVFCNFVLADEINRAPAKVQSALLEAMQEKQVSIGEETFVLDEPFLVLATQNPIEQEGTYPLPEAQMDRFMMKVHLDYLSKEEELLIMKRATDRTYKHTVQKVLDRQDILQIKKLINHTTISDSLCEYIVHIVLATRKPEDYDLKDLKNMIRFGASPRASIALNLASRALAIINGRTFVLPEDIKQLAVDVLNHRIILSYESDIDGIQSKEIIEKIIEKIPIE